MLTLDDYQPAIRLGEPFVCDTQIAGEDYPALVSELLGFFSAEAGRADTMHGPTEAQRRRLKALLTVRPPQPLEETVWRGLDQLFQFEKRARVQVDPLALPTLDAQFSECRYRFADRTALWQGDISLLAADSITNAANNALLGCFQPFHACIDNVIHSFAGPRLRDDCDRIMQLQGEAEETGHAKLTRAYHLPSRYVAHTVGPIVAGGQPSTHQQTQLADCYRNILDVCDQRGDVRSIAFCCISTGVFGYPQEAAARTAVRAVEQWRSEHRDSAIETVVFNVFRDDDLDIYRRILAEY